MLDDVEARLSGLLARGFRLVSSGVVAFSEADWFATASVVRDADGYALRLVAPSSRPATGSDGEGTATGWGDQGGATRTGHARPSRGMAIAGR